MRDEIEIWIGVESAGVGRDGMLYWFDEGQLLVQLLFEAILRPLLPRTPVAADNSSEGVAVEESWRALIQAARRAYR